MWTMAAPASAARLASSPISIGVYGMAGHWSRVASTPVSAAVTMVLVIRRKPPRAEFLTGRVADRPPLAQIERRKVRWRGGGSPHSGGGRAPAGYGRMAPAGRSYRDVSVLPPRAVDFLVPRLLDASDDHPARLGGGDDVIDHRPTRGEGRGDLRPDTGDKLAACLLRVVGCLDLLVEDDVDGALRSHHRDLRKGPRDDQVWLITLAAHDVIARAICLAHDHRDLGHSGLGRRVKHLRAVADDPILLDL